MLITKSIKISFFLAFASILFLQGCASGPAGDNANVPPVEADKTDPPFPNKEPEKYQAEIWLTTAAGVEKYNVVRSGSNWRIDSAYGDPSQVTSLHTDKEYVISFASKTYAEYPTSHGFDEREDTVAAISQGMLNGKAKAVFEKIDTANGMTRYKVLSEAGKSRESIVTFDEKLGLPVKKEIFKTNESERTLEMTVTLSGFKTDVDENLFKLPKGVKKASIEEMKKTLSGIK